jgi:hypothetical protein
MSENVYTRLYVHTKQLLCFRSRKSLIQTPFTNKPPHHSLHTLLLPAALAETVADHID